MEIPVPLVWMDVQVIPEILDRMVLPVPMVNLGVVESMDVQGRREPKVYPVFVVILEMWVLLVMKDLWVPWDHLERM